MCKHKRYTLLCYTCRQLARTMAMQSDTLPIAKSKTFDGYYIDDVLDYLTARYDKYTALNFSKFIMGQTGGWEDGKMVVYSWDLSRFLYSL